MIRLSKTAGFCPGVKRATSAVEQAIADKRPGEKIYTIGALIHNESYTADLARAGVELTCAEALPALVEAADGHPVTAVIRTHGIPREKEAVLRRLEAEHKSFRVLDMTCPSVKRIHKIAAENTSEETVFLLYAVADHPEAEGIMSYAKGEKHAFDSLRALSEMDFSAKIPILCAQTTQNLEEYKKIKEFLKNHYTNAVFFDTICCVTENRQKEAVQIAAASDTMIVIGGKSSSNTHRLYDLCRQICPATYWVEEAGELPDDVSVEQNIGITAGASTPDGIITEVLKTMSENENFEKLLEEASRTTLHNRETVTGIVYNVTDNEIFLDLGAKFTGVIAKDQITADPAANLHEMFKVGDEVTAFVVHVDDGKGIATLSKTRADRDKSWVILKNAHDDATIVEGTVVSADKGGVVMMVEGNRVFVPASQTGIARDGDLTVLVNTKQRIKVIEFDETKKRAIGSIKVVLAEEKKAREEAVWATLEVGQRFTGVVKNLTPYGAFVDIGGVDGMVHNSELSWKRIKHPSQVVSVGQTIEVYIKELDPEKKRISLGYKTPEMDTWAQFVSKYRVGDILPGKIVSIMPFGAFAEVYEDVDGLIHISRISTERINNPADVLSIGQVVDVMITEIDNENRKLALSIRAITEAAQKKADEEARAAEAAQRRAEADEEAKKLAEERADMAPYIVGSID